MYVKMFIVLLWGLVIASGSMAAEKKKRPKSKGKKAVESQRSAQDLARFQPQLAPIGNSAPIVANTQLRLKSEDVSVVAARIDQVIKAKLSSHGETMNRPCEDSTFVRRVYLSIAGRIPSPEETHQFVNDSSSRKRAELIDRLLVSDGYRSHQFNWLADMLRYQSTIKRSNFALYERWLKDQVASNRRWDAVVGDLLTAEGSLASNGASGYLIRDAGMPLDALSNTVTLFLGANVACAQCHDHPLADWTQREFLEMAAFFGATDVSSRDPRKIGKKLRDAELSKQDLIIAVAPNLARVKTTAKNSMVYPHDYAYDDVKPGAPVTPGIVYWADRDSFYPEFESKNPKVLRQSFASWLTHKDNPRFAVAIGNRLWRRAFGVAVQEPVEDLDDLSLAENPELLQLIGNLVVRTGFDLREVQRVIYNTRAFQATATVMPSDAEMDDYLFAGPVLRRMTAEQTWDSAMLLVGGAGIDEVRVDKSHTVTRFAYDYDAMDPIAVKKTALAMKKAGYLNTGRSYDARHFEGKKPVGSTTGGPILRASEMSQPSRGDHFLQLFGQSTREIADDGSLEGNIPQSLMLMNGTIQQVLTDKRGRLLTAMQRMNDDASIQHLYWSFYSRAASADERETIRDAMHSGTTLTDLVWVLFNTPEFLFIK